MTEKLLAETRYWRAERWIINAISSLAWYTVTFPRRLWRLISLLRIKAPKAVIKAELRLMVGKRTYEGDGRGTPITEDNLRSFGFRMFSWTDGCREWWMSLLEDGHLSCRACVRFDGSNLEHGTGSFLILEGQTYPVRQAKCIEDIDMLVDLLHEQPLEERMIDHEL